MHYVFGVCGCCGFASADKWQVTIEFLNCTILCHRINMSCRLFCSRVLRWVSIADNMKCVFFFTYERKVVVPEQAGAQHGF